MKYMVLAGFALIAVAQAPAPAAAFFVPELAIESPAVLIAGGCGQFGHRGPLGGCRRGGQASPVCPPGFHLGPQGRRCRPNNRR